MGNDFKSIPMEDRPREKALRYGFDTLSDSELLALILKTGIKGISVMALSNSILNTYYNFNNLMNSVYKDLINIVGINKVKAIEILAIMEIAKRIQKNKIMEVKVINSPEDIYNNFSLLIKEEKQEVFMVIYLNIKSHIIKYEKLFVGGCNFSIIDVNLIFKNAISYGAYKIICVHNHPSGDPTPSKQDILITKKINMTGEMVDIKLIDHIIIGKKTFVSLKKEGMF